jgi:SAM-dependent methyltransferase
MPKIYFDDRIAERYETYWPELFEPAVIDPAVSFLAERAGTGAALELGIGTGRLALPLSQRGVRVHGIELSTAMVEQLQAKPGSDDIDVTIGDFATSRVDGTFSVAYLVRNTITNLTTQDEQVECFRNVAAHLDPGGCFVIELYIPEPSRFRRVRRRHADRDLSPLLGDRRTARDLLVTPPLRLAVRAGSDGTTRGDDLARALERLDPRTLHERQPATRFGLGENLVALRRRSRGWSPRDTLSKGQGPRMARAFVLGPVVVGRCMRSRGHSRRFERYDLELRGARPTMLTRAGALLELVRVLFEPRVWRQRAESRRVRSF